jgi:bifunctional DNA-binding transcriptional regulator/antitoxin component of YhaV-PrlF toxin-antitoxin module
MQKSRVGSKGEIFPPKKIRDKLGLRPKTEITYKIEGTKLIVEPVPTLEDVLTQPTIVEETLDDIRKFRQELSRKAESL